MIKTLQYHLSIGSIIGAIFGAITLSFTLILIINVFEFLTPTSYWFEYNSVTPTKDSFGSWELLSFLSKVERKHWVNMQRQDLAYCKESESSYQYKLPTQIRPNQSYEYMTPAYRESIRQYFIPIPIQHKLCKMCGNAIWRTSYGYEKIYSYCTQRFKVNQ